jgi:hypothetical protein
MLFAGHGTAAQMSEADDISPLYPLAQAQSDTDVDPTDNVSAFAGQAVQPSVL